MLLSLWELMPSLFWTRNTLAILPYQPYDLNKNPLVIDGFLRTPAQRTNNR